MAKRHLSTGVGVGSSSILVIFILLCLTTFATLSMVSANSDLKLTEKMAASTRAYYDADARAELILAEIDGVLWERWNAAGPESYADAVLAEMASREQITEAVQEPDGTIRVGYVVPVSDSRQLSVKLRVLSDASDGKRFVLEEWAVETAAEWEPEAQGFDLWDGEDGGFLLPGNFPGEE